MADTKISDLTNRATGAASDILPVVAGGANYKMTAEVFLAIINGLTQLASGVDFDADFLAIYDADAGAIRKVLASLLQTEFHISARVTNSIALEIPNGASTALTFDTDRYDPADMHSVVSNTSRITAPKDGFYIFGGSVQWEANTSNIRLLTLRLGGATELAANGINAGGSDAQKRTTITSGYYLTASQYIELVAYQSSGAALDIEKSGNKSPEFWMTRIA